MKELKLDLENCYGIQKMKESIDFSNKNISIIYAANGTMKSSLAKTFEDVRDANPVQERIFGYSSVYKLLDENNTELNKDNIIVINPFNKQAFENQGLLMANEKLRKQYLTIHKNIDEMKQKIYEQIKSNLGYTPRKNFDVENTMLRDFCVSKKELFKCLKNIYTLLDNPEMVCELDNNELDYNALFNDKVIAMVTTDDTSKLIEEYEIKYNELLEKSLYMRKGIIDHNNYSNISSSLSSNGFFDANNEVTLNAKDGSASIVIKTQKEIDDIIASEKEKILNTKELKVIFEKINKLFIKNADTRSFNSFLVKHPCVVSEYKDIDKFRKKIWIKAFQGVRDEFEVLIEQYENAFSELSILREKANQETTDWRKALELFKKRFFVPFKIEISNQDDVILNAEMPSFKYLFVENRGEKEVQKENLLEVLSTGEERAYYILNMVFQILVAKLQGKEKIIVLDDVSESFDYKNKHAIIEYINDISCYKRNDGEPMFNILLLTHNFDFYRSVSSRITTLNNAYIAYAKDNEIKLEKGYYTKNISETLKQNLNKDRNIVASIPFVRNLIEFTYGKKNEDYITLTKLLHYKNETKNITLKQLIDIFNKYWCLDKKIVLDCKREQEIVYDMIIEEAEKIRNVEEIYIENKLVLSMTIRILSEGFMINKIINNVPSGDDLVRNIAKNQTGELISIYKENFNDSAINVLSQVSMLTTENIHLNSFMFEPILDMSLIHLYKLYQEVKSL